MYCVFELYVTPSFDADSLLTEETRRETEAKIFTREGAARAGLQGLPEPRPGREVRYVLVDANHRRWIERAVEMNAHIAGFDVHDVG
jgi:hypothetical protein